MKQLVKTRHEKSPWHGGSFWYCWHTEKIPHGISTCMHRIRSAKAMRRHRRRVHGCN